MSIPRRRYDRSDAEKLDLFSWRTLHLQATVPHVDLVFPSPAAARRHDSITTIDRSYCEERNHHAFPFRAYVSNSRLVQKVTQATGESYARCNNRAAVDNAFYYPVDVMSSRYISNAEHDSIYCINFNLRPGEPWIQDQHLQHSLTGITGYIAGDAFFALYQAHPEYEYAALVRSEDKAAVVRKAYPSVRIVLGGLDDAELLKKEAAASDIVLHAADASDNEGAAHAIAAGLAAGHSKERPGFWLHTGGTGILVYSDVDAGNLGVPSDKEYNDWSGVRELTTLPDHAFHRNVDKIVLDASAAHPDAVKTCIVCPPTIYGKGRGPASTRGRQVYELAHLILTKRYVPVIGEGRARWNNVHVADLAQVYVLLVEAAAAGNVSPEIWGERGYMVVENGEHYWTELAEEIARAAEERGYVDGKLQRNALEEKAAKEQAGFEAISWGLNSRAKAERANKTLGWKPTATLRDEVPDCLLSPFQKSQPHPPPPRPNPPSAKQKNNRTKTKNKNPHGARHQPDLLDHPPAQNPPLARSRRRLGIVGPDLCARRLSRLDVDVRADDHGIRAKTIVRSVQSNPSSKMFLNARRGGDTLADDDCSNKTNSKTSWRDSTSTRK
nr:uncharacterized protein c2a9.02 [Quercus suber]